MLYRLLYCDLGTAPPVSHTIRNSVLNGHIIGAGSDVFKSGRIGKWQA